MDQSYTINNRIVLIKPPVLNQQKVCMPLELWITDIP